MSYITLPCRCHGVLNCKFCDPPLETSKQILLDKEYDAEDLSDAERDVSECFENAVADEDEHGFERGMYKIIVTYEEDPIDNISDVVAIICSGCDKIFYSVEKEAIQKQNSNDFFCSWRCWHNYR